MNKDNGIATIDLSRLRALSGDDDEFTIEMVGLIIEKSKETIPSLNESFDSKDWDRIAFITHKFKSTINILGETRLLELTKEIEYHSKEIKNEASAAPLVEEFTEAGNRMLEELEAELHKLQA